MAFGGGPPSLPPTFTPIYKPEPIFKPVWPTDYGHYKSPDTLNNYQKSFGGKVIKSVETYFEKLSNKAMNLGIEDHFRLHEIELVGLNTFDDCIKIYFRFENILKYLVFMTIPFFGFLDGSGLRPPKKPKRGKGKLIYVWTGLVEFPIPFPIVFGKLKKKPNFHHTDIKSVINNLLDFIQFRMDIVLSRKEIDKLFFLKIDLPDSVLIDYNKYADPFANEPIKQAFIGDLSLEVLAEKHQIPISEFQITALNHLLNELTSFKTQHFPSDLLIRMLFLLNKYQQKIGFDLGDSFTQLNSNKKRLKKVHSILSSGALTLLPFGNHSIIQLKTQTNQHKEVIEVISWVSELIREINLQQALTEITLQNASAEEFHADLTITISEIINMLKGFSMGF